MKKIISVTLDLNGGDTLYETYYLGQTVKFTNDGTSFYEETIKSIKFIEYETVNDLVIETEEGSTLCFNPKYVVSWIIK